MTADLDVGSIRLMILRRYGLLYRLCEDAQMCLRQRMATFSAEDESNVSKRSRAYTYLVLSQESRIYFYYVVKF
jgi:hypothetical protein